MKNIPVIMTIFGGSGDFTIENCIQLYLTYMNKT